MKLKIVTVFCLLAFVSLGLYAQEPHAIEFTETTHDFGTEEQGTKTQNTFVFKNVSDKPVTLTNVKASCGCTTPKWTREEVKPGESGEIQVTYNSNRIGPFNKSVRVSYNERPDPVMLYIKGKINAKPNANAPGGTADAKNNTPKVVAPPKPAINYGVPRGALAFEKMIENVKSMTSDETKQVEFRYKNSSAKPVTILMEKTEADPEVTFVPTRKILQPGEESTLSVTISGAKMKDQNAPDGYFSKRIVFFTDEATENRKQLSVNGTYKRIYTEAEKAASPKIEFETTSVNGGKIIEGEKFIYDFKFKNTGKGPLVISSAKASCGCTATKPPKESIAPGESESITATFNSKGRIGKQSKSITVKSNDTNNSTVVLKFTVEVVKDPFHAGSMMGGSK